MHRLNYLLLIPCLLVLTVQLIAMDNERIPANTPEIVISLNNMTKYTLRIFTKEDAYSCYKYEQDTSMKISTANEIIEHYSRSSIITEITQTTECELYSIKSGQSCVCRIHGFEGGQKNQWKKTELCVRRENDEATGPALVSVSSEHSGSYKIVEDDNNGFRVLIIK